MVDATADALVADEAVPATPETPPVESEDDALDAAWDRAQEGPEEPAEEVAAEEPEEPEKAEAPVAGVPNDLPAGVREHWANIPSEARDAIAKSQRELSSKLAEQGRIQSGLKPIQDTLVQAAREMPALAKLTPDQIAKEMFQLARVSQSFNDNPVGALMGLVDQHGLRNELAQALGQQPQQDNGEIRSLKAALHQTQQELAQMRQVASPEFLRTQFSQFMGSHTAESEVAQFAGKAEHWGEVEDYLPLTIPIVQQKLGQNASRTDVLQAAYDLAISQFVPQAQAQKDAQVASGDDPKRKEAAARAKSINVTGARTGKARELTEDEAMDAAWERAQRA